MKNVTFLLLFALLSFSLAAQDNKENNSTLKITGLHIKPSIEIGSMHFGTIDDFRELAPQSELLQNDFVDFQNHTNHGITSSSSFSIMSEFEFWNKNEKSYRKNPLLRIGIGFTSENILAGNKYREISKPFDTLVSNTSGVSAFSDSITATRYGMEKKSEQLYLKGDLIFRTDPEKRWSIYAGIGLSLGVSINSSTDVYYFQDRWISTKFSNGHTATYEGSYNENYTRESHKNKSIFGFTSYIPMGLDFRLGKKSEFWKRIHLFYEFQPTIQVYSIPELYTITSANIQQGGGLRVVF